MSLSVKKKLIGLCKAGGDVSYVASRYSDINGLDFHYNPPNPMEIDQIAMCTLVFDLIMPFLATDDFVSQKKNDVRVSLRDSSFDLFSLFIFFELCLKEKCI